MLWLCFNSTANARYDPPKYRVTWITNPAAPTTTLTGNYNTHGTMGINNRGVTVYGVNVSGTHRAWVWLPDERYYLSAGWHNIGTLVTGESIARDVNDYGVIVGQSVLPQLQGNYSRVAVWVPDGQGSFDAFEYESLDTESELPWCGAHAINNHQFEPTVVGVSSVQRFCDCDDAPLGQLKGAFRLQLDLIDPGHESLVEIAAGAGRNHNYALAVNTADPPLIVGTRFGFNPCSNSLLACEAQPQGVFWDPDPNHVYKILSASQPSYDNEEPLGVNDAGNVVGWEVEEFEEPQPPNGNTPRAVFLETPDQGPGFALGHLLVDGDGEDNATKALAINNALLPQVVGYNVTWTSARLWTKTGSQVDDWQIEDLNQIIGASKDIWTITQAHDINDGGWIAAVAAKIHSGSPLGFLSVVLSPFPQCPQDVNGDTYIDQDDIDDILENWPPSRDQECPINVICRWDVNGDYLINATDIYLVNNSWCLGGSSLVESESSLSLSLAELIARVYLTSHDAETQAEIILALIEHWE